MTPLVSIIKTYLLLGTLERPLAGASPLSILIGGRQMCWESSPFPSISVRMREIAPPALCASHRDLEDCRPGRGSSCSGRRVGSLAAFHHFKGMSFNSYFSGSQTLFCKAPELASQGMSMLFPRQCEFCFM